jgi:hypothetical protein
MGSRAHRRRVRPARRIAASPLRKPLLQILLRVLRPKELVHSVNICPAARPLSSVCLNRGVGLMERLLLQDLKLAWKNGRNINTKLRFAVAFLCLMLAVRIGAGNAGLA